MNIAIINQNNSKYLFEVPESITLKEGEKVKCDTRRGVTDGIVWADSITVDEPAAKLIGKLLGAKFPLKSVVGKTVTSVEMFEQPKQEPVKLYCVEDYSGFTTKGKVYEFTDGDIRLDDGYHRSGWFTDYADFVSYNKGIAACLVPLVSRPAKVGEWILCTRSEGGFTHNGDLYQVVECGGRLAHFNDPRKEYGCTNSLTLDSYLVLDGYKPEPEKAEPEYLNMRVVCVAGSSGFTIGKVYEFKNGVVVDDDGDVRPSNGDQKITSLSDAYLRDWENKFIEFKGE